MVEVVRGYKLGDLVTLLGLATDAQLSTTGQLALQAGLPLGRSLVLSGALTENQLRLVLEIQSLMKTQGLPLDVAKNAVELVLNEGVILSEALRRLAWKEPGEKKEQIYSLGKLLVDAGVISPDQLDEAQRSSYETGLPIGRMLVLTGAITHSTLARSVEVYTTLKEKRISADAARQSLAASSTSSNGRPLAELAGGVVRRKTIRIGELLMLAGLVSDTDIMDAVELAFSRRQTMGETFIELGLISQSILDTAVKLQDQVHRAEITVTDASDSLHRLISPGTRGYSQDKAPAVQNEQMKLGELLRQSGFVTAEDIRSAVESTQTNAALIGKMLLAGGSIDEATLLAALRVQFLVKNNFLESVDAIKALQYANAHRLSLDDALEELGLRLPTSARATFP